MTIRHRVHTTLEYEREYYIEQYIEPSPRSTLNSIGSDHGRSSQDTCQY